MNLLTRGRGQARALSRALDRAGRHAATLQYALDRTDGLDRVRVRDLIRALDHDVALALDNALALDDALDRNPALALDLGVTFNVALALDNALDRALLALIRALDHALHFDRNLDRSPVQELAHALDRARARTRYLIEVLDMTYSLTKAEKNKTRGAGTSAQAISVAAQPVHSAQRINEWAVHLLPPAARARHRDELLDELYDLADQHASWRQQVACTLRQLASVRQLRAAARAERTMPSAIGE